MHKKLIPFLLLILATVVTVRCQTYEPLERKTINSKKPKLSEWIWISEDMVLRNVLSQRFNTDIFTTSEDFNRIASIEITDIESKILYSESLLYSLATLTMGTFEIIESEYTFSVKYLDGIQIDEQKFIGRTKYTMKTFMPPYIGLGTTSTLILLDGYKTPENLKKYCMEEKPGRLREILEADKDTYCKEYEKYIRSAWQSVEGSIEADLKRRRK